LGRVIAVDLIGMGRSDKPAIGYRYGDHYAYLEEFIDALGLEGITSVLHDWGSVLGFRYAMEHEARIRAIAFMEANVRPRYSWEEFEGPAGDLFRQFPHPRHRLGPANRAEHDDRARSTRGGPASTD